MTLSFGARNAAVLSDLSAAARSGDTLFVGNDETASIHALRRKGQLWALDDVYPLKSLLSLPGGSNDEVDIEALAVHGGYLWVTGSHSLVRKRADEGGKKALRRLGEIDRRPNRFVLARIPIEEKKGKATLVAQDDNRRSEQLESGKRSSALIKWVEDDSLLKPFLDFPAKENGFDIEGLEVANGATWLGLRGPVIRGHAAILQMYLTGAKRGALKARKLEDGRRFRKYLLPLDGLGVRDLAACGDDMLILAGPTMTADGPAAIYRWSGAIGLSDSQVVDEDRISMVADLSVPGRQDKAEALALWDSNTALVLHDSPSPGRIDLRTGSVQADLISLLPRGRTET